MKICWPKVRVTCGTTSRPRATFPPPWNTFSSARARRKCTSYIVSSGVPAKRFSSVQIAGNRYFDLETIRERLLIQERTMQQRRGRFSQSLLERDVDAIEELYRTNGFRTCK